MCSMKLNEIIRTLFSVSDNFNEIEMWFSTYCSKFFLSFSFAYSLLPFSFTNISTYRSVNDLKQKPNIRECAVNSAEVKWQTTGTRKYFECWQYNKQWQWKQQQELLLNQQRNNEANFFSNYRIRFILIHSFVHSIQLNRYNKRSVYILFAARICLHSSELNINNWLKIS